MAKAGCVCCGGGWRACEVARKEAPPLLLLAAAPAYACSGGVTRKESISCAPFVPVLLRIVEEDMPPLPPMVCCCEAPEGCTRPAVSSSRTSSSAPNRSSSLVDMSCDAT